MTRAKKAGFLVTFLGIEFAALFRDQKFFFCISIVNENKNNRGFGLLLIEIV